MTIITKNYFWWINIIFISIIFLLIYIYRYLKGVIKYDNSTNVTTYNNLIYYFNLSHDFMMGIVGVFIIWVIFIFLVLFKKIYVEEIN